MTRLLTGAALLGLLMGSLLLVLWGSATDTTLAVGIGCWINGGVAALLVTR